MTPLARAISGALVQFVWQGLLVSILVAAAGFLLRKSDPRIRYFLYCVSLFALAVLPIMTAAALYDPLAGNVATGPADITLTIRAVWNGSVSPGALFLRHWLDESQPAFDSAFQPWILRIWIIGVAFFSLRLAWLASRVATLRRSGGPATGLILAVTAALSRRMGMRRAVRVLVSAIPDGPSVVGWFRPVILLPAATIFNLPADQLEAILAHEIAHLRRYDDIVNIAQSVIETLLFYHPAVWWISNRIRHERELCCDDLAVRASGNALCYARALTALERLRVNPPGLALPALGHSPLEHRIRRIVGADTEDYLPKSLPGMLALALALACIAIYSSPAHGSAPLPLPPERFVYPESARLDGIEGTVPVEVKIDDSGRVSGAKAMGGPKELRQAAVESASALHFAPETPAGMEQVNVEFQLAAPGSAQPPAAPAQTAVAAAVHSTEPNSITAAAPLTTPQALLAVMEQASGNTDPVVLEAGKRAGQQLEQHFDNFFGDAPRALATASELRIHNVLAYIALTEKDYATAEEELKKALLVDPGQAVNSYQLGTTIIRQMAINNELTRYSEAIYNFARSLAITGPNALPPDAKAAAESALMENYWNYHGGADGLDELMKQVGASALPPANFHIVSSSEQDSYFARIRGVASQRMFQATVVSQPSPNYLIVKVDDVPSSDAVLRFDGNNVGVIRPGAVIRFRGVIDSYTLDPYVVTFVIQNPKEDIITVNAARPRRGSLLSRIFKGVGRFFQHLA